MLKAACIVLFVGLVASDTSMSSVISRILNQAKNSRSRAPVILIVNSKALQDSSSMEVPMYRQNSGENGLSMLSMLLSQLQQSRPNPASNRYRARPDRLQANSNRNKQGKKFPVYKSLLSLRNRLRCGARDECVRDECSDLPKKQEAKCEMKCEVKYECDDDAPKEDDCGGNDCDDGNISTKGVVDSPETQTSCPRC